MDGAFQEGSLRPLRVGFGVVTAMALVDVRRREQLHRHRRDLGHLRARMALEHQRQVGGLENMKAMSRLVEQRPHVLVDADCVHEDKRHLAHRQRVAVTAGCLAFAVVKVEQLRVGHFLEVGVEVRLDVLEDLARAGDEISHVAIGLEWCSALRIHPQVPRLEPLHAKMLATHLEQPFDGGYDGLLYRLVKAKAVVGRVVEAVLLAMHVIAIVVES